MTRRNLIQLAASFPCGTALCGSQNTAQISPVLVNQKKECRTFEVANDQEKIAVFLGDDITQSFIVTPDFIREIQKNTKAHRLAILTFPDLKELTSLAMPHLPVPTGFSESAKTILFTESGHHVYTAMSADLQKKDIVKNHVPGKELCYPYTDRELMIAWRSQPGPRLTDLGIYSIEENRIVRSNSYVPSSVEPNREYDYISPIMSQDRNVLLHPCGEYAVCRRVDDLSVLWAKRLGIDPWVRGLGLSRNGKWAAVARAKRDMDEKVQAASLLIIHVMTGDVVADLPYAGDEGMSLSSDGSLIAVALRTRFPDDEDRYRLEVVLLDTKSGKERGRIFHADLKRRRGRVDTHFSSIDISPDDRFLVVSARDTQVWKL